MARNMMENGKMTIEKAKVHLHSRLFIISELGLWINSFLNYICTSLYIIYLGICYYVNGNTYDGEWKNGKKDGKGIISIPECSLFLNLNYGYIHFLNSIFT